MTDDDLRNLLNDAVSDVHPDDARQAIRHQTEKVTPMKNNSWLMATLGAAAAVAVIAGGLALINRDDNNPVNGPVTSPTSTPTTASSDPTQSPTGDPTGTAEDRTVKVPVYYVGETPRGPKLFREFHVVTTTGTDVAAAIKEAMSGNPQDADYKTLWPTGTSATSVSFDGVGNDGLIQIVLSDTGARDRPSGMSQAQAQATVEQLIYTAQAATKTRAPVQFRVGNNPVDQVLGVPTSEPLAEGSAEEVLSPVWIIDPAEGASLNSGFTVTGLAASFEANVVWELKQGNTVVKSGFTTAAECCKRAPYSFKVVAPAGTYTLVVHDDDPSGGEGPGVTEDTKSITIK